MWGSSGETFQIKATVIDSHRDETGMFPPAIQSVSDPPTPHSKKLTALQNEAERRYDWQPERLQELSSVMDSAPSKLRMQQRHRIQIVRKVFELFQP